MKKYSKTVLKKLAIAESPIYKMEMINKREGIYWHHLIANYNGENKDKIISDINTLLRREVEYRITDNFEALITDEENEKISSSNIYIKNLY